MEQRGPGAQGPLGGPARGLRADQGTWVRAPLPSLAADALWPSLCFLAASFTVKQLE